LSTIVISRTILVLNGKKKKIIGNEKRKLYPVMWIFFLLFVHS